MFRREAAKREASEPPAPGWSSRRQGRWAKGWGGVRVRFRIVVRWVRVLVVVVMSVEARERSSASLVGSERRAWSSVRDCIGR
jgi:hypothetical protein